MGEDTLPAEVWADMCEDAGQDTLLLRAWLVDQQSHSHDPYWMDMDRRANAGESTYFGISTIFINGSEKGSYTGGPVGTGHGFMMYTFTHMNGYMESGHGGHAY